MGHIYVDAVLSAERSEVVRMLVDTGATYSLVSDALAKRLGMPRLPKRTRVRLADGSVRRADVGIARLRLEGREAASTFIIGRVAEPLLGSARPRTRSEHRQAGADPLRCGAARNARKRGLTALRTARTRPWHPEPASRSRACRCEC
jgi:predicted aspartyl protease